MPKCNGCGEEMSEEDLKRIEDVEYSTGVSLTGNDYCCIDCKDGFALFLGDNSMLHPDETDEEFFDHEG